MITEIEKFKQETAKQVVAAITEKQASCVFFLMHADKQKEMILDKAEIILKAANIEMTRINLVPVAPDETENDIKLMELIEKHGLPNRAE